MDLEPDEKVTRIIAACKNHDLPSLKELATSTHGLVNDQARRAACEAIETDTEARLCSFRLTRCRAHFARMQRIVSGYPFVDWTAAASGRGSSEA